MTKFKTLAASLVRQAAALRRCWLPTLLMVIEVLLVIAAGLPAAWGVCAAGLGLDVAAALLAGRPGLFGLVAQLFLVAHTTIGVFAWAALLGQVTGALAGAVWTLAVTAAIILAVVTAYADWLRVDCLR